MYSSPAKLIKILISVSAFQRQIVNWESNPSLWGNTKFQNAHIEYWTFKDVHNKLLKWLSMGLLNIFSGYSLKLTWEPVQFWLLMTIDLADILNLFLWSCWKWGCKCLLLWLNSPKAYMRKQATGLFDLHTRFCYITNVFSYNWLEILQPQGHGYAVIGIAWNHGENLLASSDFGGTVIVWKRAKTN